MARRRRKKHPRKWAKRNELKRTCPSGKVDFADRGQADAAIRRRGMVRAFSYRCKDCKKWHIADKVGRKERRRRAEGGGR